MEKQAIRGSTLFTSFSIRPYAYDTDLRMREFLKSLTDRAYTLYINLKPGSVPDLEHFGSLYNSKLFFDEAKFH